MVLPLVLALTLQQSPAAPPAAAEPARSAAPRIEWTELPPDLPSSLRDSVRFGWLEVPQDHAEPAGSRIRIAIALLPARQPAAGSGPVVSIAGGPGLAAIETHMHIRSAGPHPLDALRERRDLIVIDPRGHGYSGPQRCRELAGAEPLAENAPAAERLWLEKLAGCRARLHAEGVRLETLSSVQAAHDLELLRHALGAPQLNLVGLSYGSRIAAEAVRQFPSSIRAVYYSGPVPAGHFGHVARSAISGEVLGTLMERCAGQPACNAAYPHLRADYDTILARLRRAPFRLAVPRSDAAPDGVLIVDEQVMREGLGQLVLNRQLAAGAPLLIHTLAGHGLAHLGSNAALLMREIGDSDIAPGTFLSFWCNDGVVSRTSTAILQERCRVWLGDAWDGRRAEPVRSDIPGLIETGELDPRTPPSYARALAAGLPSAQRIIVPWYGHERPPDCSMRIARAFFDAPDAPLDTACLDSIPPIEFVTGVVPVRSVAEAVGRTARRPWLAALPGAAALLLLVSAIGIPVREIRSRRRGRPADNAVESAALVLVAAVGLTFVLGLTGAVLAGMRRHFFIPLVGLPAQWLWLLALPWVLLALTAIAVFLVVRGRAAGRDTAGTSAAVRWSALLGAILVLALWFVNGIA